MSSINDMKQRAEQVRDEIQVGANTASRVGGLLVDIVDFSQLLMQNIDTTQANIERLYAKLANIAFWNAADRSAAAPIPLDWNTPRAAVTISSTLANAVVKKDGYEVGAIVLAEIGSPLTLTVEAKDGFFIEDVTATANGTAATVTELNGVYTISIERIDGATTVEIDGIEWTFAPKDDEVVGGSVVRYGMQQGRSLNVANGNTTSGMLANNTTPVVILSPAGVPTTTKIFTSDIIPGGDNVYGDPGNAAPYFFPTGGKRYLHVILGGVDVSNAEFYVAVGCFGNAVIGQTYVQSENVTGWIGRVAYAQGSGSPLTWKIDLDAFATDKGASAGDITYIKLLFSKMVGGQNEDSRLWYGDLTVKYRFSDD